MGKIALSNRSTVTSCLLSAKYTPDILLVWELLLLMMWSVITTVGVLDVEVRS